MYIYIYKIYIFFIYIYIIISASVMPPALFVFLKIALAMQDLLWFHKNFRTAFSM